MEREAQSLGLTSSEQVRLTALLQSAKEALAEAENMVQQEKGTDCEEMRKLEKANMRFVFSVANQYQKQGLTLEELIEAGNEGLVKAAEKYDLNADNKFISYAVWWIRQSIIQTIESRK